MKLGLQALASPDLLQPRAASSPGELQIYNWGDHAARVIKVRGSTRSRSPSPTNSNDTAAGRSSCWDHGFDIVVPARDRHCRSGSTKASCWNPSRQMENFKNVDPNGWKSRSIRPPYRLPWQWGTTVYPLNTTYKRRPEPRHLPRSADETQGQRSTSCRR